MMRIYTSNFSRAGREPSAVSIARSSPKGWIGRRFDLLAPEWDWVKNLKDGFWSPDEYAEVYGWLLSELDAENICAALGDGAILLCWCKPSDFCHRRLVAEWIEREMGLVVPEWNFSYGR
jgi:hypothetical protein